MPKPKKKNTKSVKFIKEGQSIKSKVKIDHWSIDYDWRSDNYELTVYWGEYGYRRTVPSASVNAMIEMFESADRFNASVFFHGVGGERKLSLSPVPT